MIETLPIAAVLDDLVSAIAKKHDVILTAPPGAGKTTAVPIALFKAKLFEKQLIVMLEPRRLAARLAASRLASLLGEAVGDTVGFQIRGEKKRSARTRILVVTEGVLTRLLQNDPELADVALLIFDEFHERSLQADLGLALALQSQELLRPDLRLLIMSATLNVSDVGKLLASAKVIQSEGRMFDVDTRYVDIASLTRQASRNNYNSHQRQTDELCRVCLQALEDHPGDMLVFLPGLAEIRRLQRALETTLTSDQRKNEKCSDSSPQVLPLYGAMSLKAQRSVLAEASGAVDSERRRIVLATNIAQTSLTINGIRIVVDSGQVRVAGYDPGSGMNRMQTVQIAQDAADQRRGRAGRLDDGICYRLWSESAQQRLPQTTAPEMLNADLSGLCLELALWGITEPDELSWIDEPPAASVASARDLLRVLGAIDVDHRITSLGKVMAGIPVNPRLAKMLLFAKQQNRLKEAAALAVLLEERSNFGRQAGADLDPRVRFILGKASSVNLERSRADSLRIRVDQLVGIVNRIILNSSPATASTQKDRQPSLGVLLAYAYPDRIAQNRQRDGQFLMANCKGAALASDDALAREPWLVIAELDAANRDARVFTACSIDEAEIHNYLSDRITHDKIVEWDERGGRVVASRRVMLDALELETQVDDKPEREAIENTLLDAVRRSGTACLRFSDKARALVNRINCLSELSRNDNSISDLLSDHSLPDYTEEGLITSMDDWLKPHISSAKRMEDLVSLDHHSILRTQIEWSTMSLIDELVPPHINVPSASSIAIDYSDPASPVLAVKMQEMFGSDVTPAIVRGRVPLLLHLLSPAGRPLQMTRDLAGFWSGSYAEVRKQMRSRYQKHFWPEDPASAAATRKTKKAMDRDKRP